MLGRRRERVIRPVWLRTVLWRALMLWRSLVLGSRMLRGMVLRGLLGWWGLLLGWWGLLLGGPWVLLSWRGLGGVVLGLLPPSLLRRGLLLRRCLLLGRGLLRGWGLLLLLGRRPPGLLWRALMLRWLGLLRLGRSRRPLVLMRGRMPTGPTDARQVGAARQAQQVAGLEGLVTDGASGIGRGHDRQDTSPARIPACSNVDVR